MTPIVYDGKTGELYKIFFMNLFLGIITLGIYHYWGKTRHRRYVTSSFILKEDRFEYTGYGSELFWGALKAFIILIIVSIPFFYAVYKQQEMIGALEVVSFVTETKETKTETESKSESN